MVTMLVMAAVLGQSPQPASPVADDRLDALEKAAVPIRSIDPGNVDFSDLEPLKGFIGDARVVQLGEQSHGDGAVFLAKCRLVKFLHERMGFDVLVWESGVFDCREADRAFRDPAAKVDEAWREGVFGIWGGSAQVKPVFEYTRETQGTARRLETAGMDCQFSSGKVGRWLDAMKAFVAPLGEEHPALRVIEALRADQGVLQGRAEERAAQGVIQGLGNLGQLLDGSREKLEAKHGAPEFEFMRRTVDDAAATARMTLAYGAGNTPMDMAKLGWRDQRMGENLIWLANERYKGKKLIVWAATMHEVNDVQAIRPIGKPDMYKGAVTAGTVAKKGLGADLYTVAFDAHEGSAARVFDKEPGALSPSPPGSLGDLLARMGGAFYYVDLRSLPEGHWLKGSFVMRPLGYMPMEARWAGQVDAVFYTRTMLPSRREKMAPEGAVLTVKEGEGK